MKRMIIVMAVLLAFASALAFIIPGDPEDGGASPSATLKPKAAAAGATIPSPAADAANATTLMFSEQGHFYEHDITVGITPPVPGAVIHYTLDGSEPTVESPVYGAPLLLMASVGNGNPRAVTLKAIAVHDGETSPVLAHTYFLGEGVYQRFSPGILIFSLSTDSKHLYDYESGILVEGRLRGEYVAANPRAEIRPPDPANFNIRGREGERPVYVEVFTPDGARVLAQAAGARVHGGWSRAEEQKSLRLIARREYSPDYGKFHYAFFPDETDVYGARLEKFDELILRNGANDRDFGMLRNELALRLAREAGFRAASPTRAAAVFLNGEYYGFAWLQTNINEQYLQDVYDAPTREFDIAGDGELDLKIEEGAARTSLMYVNGFADRDLRDDAVFAELETLLDIDNFLFYYAFQTYMGNGDWPNGNLKRWRYAGEYTEGMPSELDGRWRYVMYDLDWTLGLYGGKYDIPTLDNVLNRAHERRSGLLIALLRRQDMAERFIALMRVIADRVVSAENVGEHLRAAWGEAEREIHIALANRKYGHWVSRGTIQNNHDDILAFAARRHEKIFEVLRSRFG
jgi:hypothetical protein